MSPARTSSLLALVAALLVSGAAEAAPLWVDATGRPNADAHAALDLLCTADDDGLDPRDYSATALVADATVLEHGWAPAEAVLDFETRLGAAMVRYLRELHEGRVDPRTIGFRMTAAADRHDFAAILAGAVARHALAATAAAYRPQLPLYESLRIELRRYRALAADATLGPLPEWPRSVHPGDTATGLPALHRLLVALGDLPDETPAPGEPAPFDAALVDGVRRFQARHGLAGDGVLGPATQAALRVPLAWRARQLELAMERLRWLPHLAPDRVLVVNIPMFRLLAWGPAPRPPRPELTTGVIVGRALDRQTPVFVEEMQQVIFRPYWNVPLSIARGEILPAQARDPSYLRRHDMEIVAGQGDDARVVGVTAEALALVRQGRYRVRQRPGDANSLGLVKFVFPNDANVYLHGTPARELFARPRRDFSHGCVRVEDPVALAQWVLAGEEGWDRERILAAMGGRRPLSVELTRPIQVILFYVTAIVTEDGTVRFAADIYRHDARLDAALRVHAGRVPLPALP